MSFSLLVVLLNWNGKNHTLACLESLLKAGCPSSAIILVDNGSTDGSITEIRTHFPEIALLETGANLGYAGGNNRGIQWGLKRGFEHFLILNNDTLVDPHLFEAFASALKTYPEAGIFGAKLYLHSSAYTGRLDHLGGNWNAATTSLDFVGRQALDSETFFTSPLKLDYVCGAALLVRRAVFEKIGLFDERFFLYWEDTDFCFRARKNGFEVHCCLEAKIWHKFNPAAKSPLSTYFETRNRLLWLERHLSPKERLLPMYKQLKELPKLYLKVARKRLQIFCLNHFTQENVAKERLKLLFLKARFLGLKDYLFRRFGAGSSHLLR